MIIHQPDRILLREQIARFGPMLHGKILDIGSGQANRYKHYCPNVTSYLTLDMNPDAHPDIIASAENIPIDNASMDGIICTQVLEHLPHPWIAVQEMHRILRPGGLSIVTVPQLNELHEEPHDYYRFTKYGLQTMFEDAGFIIDHMDQRGRYYATKTQNEIRQLVNWLRPYNRPGLMFFLSPWTAIKSKAALWCDAHDSRTTSSRHAIGWCAVARKP